jgi:60 kDa SS-A/Ro ribonucleoprotein
MSMVTLRTERHSEVVYFTSGYNRSNTGVGGIGDPGITANDSLNEVIRKLDRLQAGGTDCSLPMQYAMAKNRNVDYFIVYTDNETGYVNPSKVLREYRSKSGRRDAALVVVGMIANKFSIADPTDPRMLDVVGFDSSAPAAMNAFIRGEI